MDMSEDTSKRPEADAESQDPGSLSTTPSDVRQALKELASAVAKHDVDSSPEVDKALEDLASAVAGREPTEDDRRALVEFASDIGFALPEEQDAQGEAAAAVQDKTTDCASLLAKLKALLDQAAEVVVSRQSGQELIRHADSVLRVFELTAVWEQDALPEKPMPWMVLIPLLIMMKLLRSGLGLAAPCFGYNSPSIKDTIRFIRRQRRNLRALKYSGVRNMRHMRRSLPESEQQSMDPNLFELVCVLLPLRVLSGLSNFVGFKTIHRPAKPVDLQQMKRKLDEMLHEDDDEDASDPEAASEDVEGHDEEEDLNLTLTEKLDMYADIPSEEDPDYEPGSHDESTDSAEEHEETRPTEIPSIVTEEAKTGDEQGKDSSDDSVATVVEDSDAKERAAMSSGLLSLDESQVSNPDPVSLSYGSSTQPQASSSDDSNGNLSRLQATMIQVLIPRYRLVEEASGKPYHVYTIETSISGRYHCTEKRYSELLSLHRELRKEFSTPPFPPKRVRSYQTKVLQQRQQSLEQYLQIMIDSVPSRDKVLAFLGLPRQLRSGSVDPLENRTIDHQPVFKFPEDPFLRNTNYSSDVVVRGVFMALYGKPQV